MNVQLIGDQSAKYSAIEQILINRGIAPEDVEHYLHTTEDDINDPALLENMERGAKMLVSHIGHNDKIMVQIDSDCDGFTSAAVLLNYLNCICPAFVRNNIFYRSHTTKAHGIIPETVPDDVKLVIAPDSSSNDYDVHKLLYDRGVDVLVLDHHEADRFSEYACVINNQIGNYPNKSLSGVGIVYKFCCYIDNLLQVDYAEQFRDLVALGVVADIMDLKDFETRQLVDTGCASISNPFLKGMMAANEYRLQGQLTPHGISWYIAPGVNATIRVGTDTEKQILFESMLDFKAYEQIPSTKRGCKNQTETKVEQACRNCSNIKTRQNKAKDASLEIIERLIEENNLLGNQVLVIRLDESFDSIRSITGLIANHFSAKYQRPTLLLVRTVQDTKSENNSTPVITWDGSARNASKNELASFRQLCEDSGCFRLAQGHASAFGASLYDDKVDAFLSYSNSELKDIDFTPIDAVDFIYDASLVDGNELLSIADHNAIWGQGVEQPYVAINNVHVNSGCLNLFSGSTLKITLPQSSGGASLIKFGSSNEEYDSLYSELGCVSINVIGECQRNSYDNKPQIKIKDYEIVGRAAYYF